MFGSYLLGQGAYTTMLTSEFLKTFSRYENVARHTASRCAIDNQLLGMVRRRGTCNSGWGVRASLGT